MPGYTPQSVTAGRLAAAAARNSEQDRNAETEKNGQEQGLGHRLLQPFEAPSEPLPLPPCLALAVRIEPLQRRLAFPA